MSIPRSPSVLSPAVTPMKYSPMSYATPEKYAHVTPQRPASPAAAVLSPTPHSPVPVIPMASPPPVVYPSSPTVHSPAPYVSPLKARLSASPVREATILSSADRVTQLANATTEATYKEELTASRLAAARARASVQELTANNLQKESTVQHLNSEKQRQTAHAARRQVDTAAQQADLSRYKSLKAEKKMIDAESKRLREEARVAKLEHEAAATKANVDFSHQNLAASEMAHVAARASVSQSRSSVGVVKRSISASRDRKDRAEALLRESYGAVNQVSTDVAMYSDELLLAAEQERASALRKEAALNVENMASTYLAHHADPYSPVRVRDVEQAAADIEAARYADHAATSSIQEARLRTSMASGKLRGAESRLLGADAKARVSDAHFREAALNMEVGKQRLIEGTTQLERARLLERESKLCALRSKEQVVLNAQNLAKKRAVLRRAKEKLTESKEIAGTKRKEANRQLASANVADKVFAARLEKERQARIEAEEAAVRAHTAVAALTETQVGLAYAKREEEDAAVQHSHACQETDVCRREMLNEVHTLQTLESTDSYLRPLSG